MFIAIKELSVHAIISWLDTYRYGKEHHPLGTYGRNNYIATLKWYCARSKIVKFKPTDLNPQSDNLIPPDFNHLRN